MDLREINEYYSSRMAQIHLYQRAMKELASKELKNLYEYEKTLEQRPELEEFSHSLHNMAFRRAKDGEPIFFGKWKLSIKDLKLSVVLHKNKQYQWLLSEAYEEFEDCLERLYAYAGYMDPNFWPLSDFGNISLIELSQKTFEWFEKQASKKKDTPSSIINKFRNTDSALKTQETVNALGVNLYLAITLIEFLRHVIVHRGGIVHDKAKFKERVLNKCGLYNSGKPSAEHINFIEQFFGSGDYANTIILLEIPTHPEIPLDIHANLFDVLSGYLMAYIHIVSEFLNALHNKLLHPTTNASAD